MSDVRDWTKKELQEMGVAFHCGEIEHGPLSYTELANDFKRGQWYWTNDKETFRGPFRSKAHAIANEKKTHWGGA